MEHTLRPVLVIGSVNLDLVVSAPRFPAPGETISGGDFAIHPGGKGANQAAAAARLGHPALLCAQLGQDALADLALTALREAGVDRTHVGRTPGASGTALITTAQGRNTIVVVPGANAALTPDLLEKGWPALLAAEPGFVLAQLEIPIPTVERLAKLCAEANLPLLLDPAPASHLSSELLSHVNWLTPNETEAGALVGLEFDTADERSLLRLADALLGLGPQNIALKLGAAGVLLAGACGVHRIPAFQVSAVDSTAAGDCFNGAFAVALLRGLEPAAAARFAAAAAALSTTRAGAMPSLPTQGETEALLRASAPA